MTTNHSHGKFSFIDFEAIPEANLLIKKSKKKRVEPKVMSLLIFLANRSGSVVTRGEILAELWPNTVVGDEVISQLVYSLRNALADDAKNPKYIETIPKKGYRFIADVSVSKNEDGTPTDTIKDAISLQDKKKFTTKSKWLLTCCLFLLLGTALALFLNSQYSNGELLNGQALNGKSLQKDPRILSIQKILPVTKDKGLEGSFSFHESHNKMVYIHKQDQKVDLYLKTLGDNQSQQLTNDNWIESSPLWTDQETLLYIRKKLGLYQIIRQPLSKNMEIIYESNNAIFNLILNTSASSSVSFIEYDNYQHNKLHELKSLNLLNKKITYLHDSVLNLPSDIRHPVYAKDGHYLYFSDNSNDVKEIVSLNMKTNQYKTLTKQFSWVEHIALIDQENLLISGELSATNGLWQLNIADQSITSILPSTGGHIFTRAQLKQDQVYYATYKTSVNQVIANIEQKTLNLLPKLNSDANEYFGIYSNDNSTIYFVSNRTGYYEIWAYDIESKRTKQISQLQASFIYKPVLSHSDKHFAVVYEKEALILSIISLATGQPVTTRKIPSMKYPLTWSKDDKSIYISEHKKHVNIYQYDSETLQPQLIQQNAGLYAQENSENNTLTLVDYKLKGLVVKSLNSAEQTLLKPSIDNLDSLLPGEMKLIDHSVFSVKKEGSSRQLQQYSIENNEHNNLSKKLMNLPDWSQVTDFNADGSKAIFFKRSPAEGDIMVLQLGQ